MTNWLLACLCLLALTVSCSYGQVEKEYYLPYRSGGVDYQHFDLEKDGIRMPGRTYIKIWLKAKNDAHFLLQKVKTDYFNNVVEIVIGGWGNGKSVIRDRQQGPALGTKNHVPLSSSTYRPFWYSWAGGCIKVGTGHTIDTNIFMEWCGVTHAINYLSIGAGFGSDGWMKFDVMGTLQTPAVPGATPDYTKADVHGEGVRIKGMNYLKFQVRAAQQAYVLLQKTRFDYTSDVAEIALDIPSSSALRMQKGGSSVATYSSSVLSGTQFRDFWVKWTGNCIWVGKGIEIDKNYMIDWCGASGLGRNLEFNYLSISTANNNDGNWIINRTICTSNCPRSCTDVKCAQDNVPSGVYTLYNTANEPFDVYCEFLNGYGYQYVSAKTTVDLPIGNLFKEDKSHVMMRHFRTDGTQYETKIEQLSSYSSRDLSVQYNSYTGYKRPHNDAMTPYIYFSLIEVAGMNHNGKTLGYKAAGQDQTYVNCDGNQNSYWAFLFNQGHVAEVHTPGINTFMSAWVDLGTKVSTSRHMPSDYASFYEMHMGGCGGYSTTTSFPNVVGAALGMKFTFKQSTYGSWGACSASCSVGQQTRSKTCNGISHTDTRLCHNTPCQVTSTTQVTGGSTVDMFTKDFRVDDYYKSVVFKVKSSSSAKVLLLKEKGVTSRDMVEVEIGGAGNTKTSIRTQLNGPDVQTVNGAVLDGGAYKTFWLSWEPNCIKLGKGSVVGSNLHIEWCALTHNIRYVSISNGGSQTATWQFPQNGIPMDASTAYDKFDLYADGVRVNGQSSLTFQVRASMDAYVLLHESKTVYTSKAVEVLLGGSTNTKSTMQDLDRPGSTVTSTKSALLTATAFRWFWLQWYSSNGKLCVKVGEGSTVGSSTLMTLCDVTSAINYVSIKTGDSDANWIFSRTLCTGTVCPTSCRDLIANNPSAASGMVTIYNGANEPYDVYCHINGSTGYTYISRYTTVDVDVSMHATDKSNVVLRSFYTNGSQFETTVSQIGAYSSTPLSVMANSFTGYTPIINRQMSPYVYLGFLPYTLINGQRNTQGYRAGNQDFTFTNCNGHANSYFVFLYNKANTNITGYSVPSALMQRWSEVSQLAPTNFPVDLATKFEFHMGGCGGFSDTTHYPNMIGAALGLKFDITCPAPTSFSYGSTAVTNQYGADKVKAQGTITYTCDPGLDMLTGQAVHTCTIAGTWDIGVMPECGKNGGWATWSNWQTCPVTCSDTPVYVNRTRTCTNPTPVNVGQSCSGAGEETRLCNITYCPVISTTQVGVGGIPVDLFTKNFRLDDDSQSVVFKVKSSSSAKVLLLKEKGVTSGDMVEVEIGGAGNTKTSIRAQLNGPDVQTVNGAILDGGVYKTFWLSWASNCIKLGKGVVVGVDLYIEWCELTHNIRYISISNGGSQPSTWQFPENGIRLNASSTYSKFDLYADGVRVKGQSSLKFQVRAPMDAYVLLHESKAVYTSKAVEVLLGRLTNTQSTMQDLDRPGATATNSKSGVLSGSAYRWFWVQWYTHNAKLCVKVGEGTNVGSSLLMKLCDVTSAINYVSIKAGGSDTNWIFERTLCTGTFCPTSCRDLIANNPSAASGMVTIYNGAKEPYDVYCHINGSTGYTYISRYTTVDVDVSMHATDKSSVVLRSFYTNGSQYETSVGQIGAYSSTPLSVMANSHTGYTPFVNTQMSPYVYLGFLPRALIQGLQNTQGYRAGNQDFSFTNCNGHANSYFVFLYNKANTNITGYSVPSALMQRWSEVSQLAPTNFPIDLATKFEFHMGGCGGFSDTTHYPNMIGAALGLKFDITCPARNATFSYGSAAVTQQFGSDKVRAQGTITYTCDPGLDMLTGQAVHTCTIAGTWDIGVMPECGKNGGWSVWGNWQTCPVTCSSTPVYVNRTRTCTNPTPVNIGQNCTGISEETQQCNITHCPVDGAWSYWSQYTACSATCTPGGVRYRNRTCTSPVPAHGGSDCPGTDITQTDTCNTQPCNVAPPVDGGWGSWEAWQGCSKTCDTGVTRRYRQCDNPAPSGGGIPCYGHLFGESSCSSGQVCPVVVDGNWGAWSSPSQCSKTCGQGTALRVRYCTSPSPSNGGKLCTGQSIMVETCQDQVCSGTGSSGSGSGNGTSGTGSGGSGLSAAYVNNCPFGYFTCNGGSITCIPDGFKCDCRNDCEDGSDETTTWASCDGDVLSQCENAAPGINNMSLFAVGLIALLTLMFNLPNLG